MEISAFVRNTPQRHEAVVATGGNERTLALPPKASGAGSAAWRRPADDTTRRGWPWPDVSPTAIAASRAILSSICDLYGRMSPL